MGQDLKYGKVTLERGEIPDNEPVIVFRGHDPGAIQALAGYRRWCIENGCDEVHITSIDLATGAFAQFQEDHPDEVRKPDTTREQIPGVGKLLDPPPEGATPGI